MAVNKERELAWQGQTDAFLRATNIQVCGNDYTATTSYGIRDLFAPPNPTNIDPRPVFLAINCVSNSPSHRQYQVLINDYSNGGGSFDFSRLLTNVYRPILDGVLAPPPAMSAPQLSNDVVEFTIPGQRGRTNRIEGTTNFIDWFTVTNFFGTNRPSRVQVPADRPERFYRVRRF